MLNKQVSSGRPGPARGVNGGPTADASRCCGIEYFNREYPFVFVCIRPGSTAGSHYKTISAA